MRSIIVLKVRPSLWGEIDQGTHMYGTLETRRGGLSHAGASQPLPRRSDLNPGCGSLELSGLQKITFLSQQPRCLDYTSTHMWASGNAWISGDQIQMPNSVWRKESTHVPCKQRKHVSCHNYFYEPFFHEDTDHHNSLLFIIQQFMTFPQLHGKMCLFAHGQGGRPCGPRQLDKALKKSD